MKIKSLAIGHGVIYYEVVYESLNKLNEIVQVAAKISCMGNVYITVCRYDSLRTRSYTVPFRFPELLEEDLR